MVDSEEMDQPVVEEGYDVFISYSHQEVRLAERLSRRIRRYRPPGSLGVKRKSLTVFRDLERLTAHPELGEALRERIADATHLLLICSPSAARSDYVDQEVAAFVRDKGTASITIVLAAGTPETSFPPALRAAYREPLYIDLRPSGSLLTDWRHFRDASLRIIAALLGVDFADLDREDHRRQRRITWGSSFTLISLAAGLATGYLIDRVPADSWRRIPLPDKYFDSTLLPIVDYAIYKPEPDIRLYLGYGAEFAAQYPDYPIGLYGGDDAEFTGQAERYLKQAGTPKDLEQPLATLRFNLDSTPGGQNKENWEGELQIRGHFEEPGGALRFTGSMSYRKPGPTAAETLIFPPTRMHDTRPLTLTPWPVSVLNQAELLPATGYLEGNLTTAWDTQSQTIIYELIDLQESFWEGNDGQWIQEALLSDGDGERQINLGGDLLKIRNLDPDSWPAVKKDDQWQVYQPPSLNRVDQLNLYRTNSGELRFHPRGIKVDRGLLAFLEGLPNQDPEYFYRLTHITAEGKVSPMETARVRVQSYDEMAKRMETLADYTLLRSTANDTWTVINGIALDADTDILDHFVADGQAGWLLLLTDRQGFYLSRDNGNSWEGFNLNETVLLDGKRLRPLVTGELDGIYVLAMITDSGETAGNNLLLRYARRDWGERLRLGLIGLLSD